MVFEPQKTSEELYIVLFDSFGVFGGGDIDDRKFYLHVDAVSHVV